jgi:hypothetical protein
LAFSKGWYLRPVAPWIAVCTSWVNHSGNAREDMNCLRSLECWNRGFESHLSYGCLCAFILFVLFCVQVAALRWADPPSKES